MPQAKTIRSRLLLLVVALLLPAALGVTWLMTHTLASEREAHTRALSDTARALSLVVDREISKRVAIAHVLAQSRFLDSAPEMSPEELRRFEGLARRSLAGMQGWIELQAAGRLLLSTRSPDTGSPRPDTRASPQPLPSQLVQIPQVQPLQSVDDAHGEAHAQVVEPVVRGGRVLLNLVLTLRPVELQRHIDMQELPAGWVATVMDSRGIVVARHPGGMEHIGRPATEDLRERMAASSEGHFESVSLDGRQTYGYFSTSAHGWTYLSAMPRERLSSAFLQAILQVGLGALFLLALGVLGARWVARRIVGPVCELKALAARLKAGQPITWRPTGLVECDEVATALADASETVRRGRSTLEQEVAEAVERTRRAEQRASRSQRAEALARLTGGVAHDFNNLLGVIKNSAHLIERHAASSDLQLPLAATMRAVATGSKLTQHLLRFSGGGPVQPRRLELGLYLPDMQELIRNLVLGRQIEITLQVAPDTAPVRVDGAVLELALVNLALNARDSMPQGGTVRLEARNAQAPDIEGLALQPGCRYVLIAVSDDGTGIAPEWVDRVFEPFFTSKAVGQGAGLGLSQVHGFCAQAGGAARVASTLGLGTTVSMLLPTDDGVPESKARAAPLASSAPSIARARVLLVEDNVELGLVTEALLQAHGAQVDWVTDATKALSLLEAQPAFDVVLSDVVMPGPVDGLELARRLRRDRPDLPVVLTSGYSQAAERACDMVVLRKPCDPEELLRALHEAMKGVPQPWAPA